ncbi:hypothetical protein F4054_10845 [Candidatus Poribacteria bacterium]|nr:hypothetical protein [Candidatus Poribacteria bacterium]MYB94398.1 hypothetical protein [Candidatus Poribacteria bacterium]MYG05591.1 hypothetical protein [Candidatus Poribacteria bacterium]MYK22742.1 hypothetical protein [Candidatus Poribacteria bacterium]
MKTEVIIALIAAGVPVLLAVVGGIIWIVREFGKVNSRLSLLEQSVKRLEDSPIYKAPFQPGQFENIEEFEIIIRPKQSET